jgi:predicted ATP-grasp superfamily ATP-dependent carboligase
MDGSASPRSQPDVSGRQRAVVLGVEHPRGIAVVRSLGRRGIPVVAVERDASARGLWSHYLSRTLLVDENPQEAVSALESLGRDGGGLLIPTNDHFLLLVSQHFERLTPFFTVTVPPWDILERLLNKPACYRLAQEAGLHTPRFFVPRDAAELDRILSTLDFTAHRYILSLRLPSSTPADTRTGRFTKVAGEDADTVRQGCLDIAARTGEFPMIAEVIPGLSDRCVGVSMVVNRAHVPVVQYCVKRLQLYLYALDSAFIHPYELGANVYCESVRDDEAVEAATRFVRQAGFYGAITVEFRRDATDGRLTLIKADPRVVRATSLSTALGLDVPAALYDAFDGGRHDVAPSYREGIAWIWPTWYLDTIWQNRTRVPLARQLWALVRNAHRVRSFAYLSLRDPMPAVVDVVRAAGNWLRTGRDAAVRVAVRPSSTIWKLSRAARHYWAARG